MSFIVLNCQVVEWVDIFANPVFKNPGIYIYISIYSFNHRTWQCSLKWHIYVSVNQIVHMFSTGSCGGVSSSKSFLFSLYNINGYSPVKVKIKSGSNHYGDAILRCSSQGPTFGSGNDLHISDNAASNSNSYTYCGNTYHLPPGYSASGFSCQFYAGSYTFTPTDVEVFYETTT